MVEEHDNDRRQDHKKRQRRSYSCGSCKSLKIKCDLQIPCSSCVKFKRTDKCLESPPRPPSKDEMTRINERKQRSKKKTRLSNIPESDRDLRRGFPTHPDVHPTGDPGTTPIAGYPAGGLPPQGVHSQMQGLQRFGPPPMGVQHAPTHIASELIPGMNSLPAFHLKQEPHFMTYQPQQQPMVHTEPPPIQQAPHPPLHYPPISQNSHLAPVMPNASPLNQYITRSTPSSTMTTPPAANGLFSVKSPPSLPSGSELTSQVYWSNPFSEDGLGSIGVQNTEDESIMVDLSMIELGKIKRLLPNSFEIVKSLQRSYLKGEDRHISQLINHETMLQKYQHIYNKIVCTTDHDILKTFKFSIVEIRIITLFFLVMADGLLLNDGGLKNFLIESSMFKPNSEVIEEWVSISKLLKTKILKYEKTTDILYLLDWYFFIKSYYNFTNQIVENYLEFNNLLNYVVLNNNFVDLIEDPEKDTAPAQMPISISSGNLPTGTNISEYPKSIEFKILARYWMQIRIVEIEYSFFQYKGSLLSSPQLKGSILPHQKVLSFLYGEDLRGAKDRIIRFDLKVWGSYYRRDIHTVSRTHIIRRYLYLYANVVKLLKDELKEVEDKYYKTQASPTPEEISSFTLETDHLEMLVNNQYTISLFVRWLSFIRVEAGYFPSLRYASYYTSMINLFNHFTLIDKLIAGKYGGSKDLIGELVSRYPLAELKPFYNCIVYSSIFLVVFKNFMDGKHQFRLDLSDSYRRVTEHYHNVVARFSTSAELVNLNKTPYYERTVGAINETSVHLQRTCAPFDTVAELIDDYQTGVRPENWEILINAYYGSQDMLVGYAEKVWDLFEYWRVPAGQEAPSEPMAITPAISLDQNMIDNTNSRLSGYVFDTAIVEDYIAHIVPPEQ